MALDFCTFCGARLTNKTQEYAQNYPTVPYQPNQTGRRGAAKLTGREKTIFGVLIAIPIVLILATVGVIGLVVYTVSKKERELERYPTPPRTSPSPQKTNLLVSFGKDGIGQGEFKNAEALAVDKNGNIYVGDGTLRIQKFDGNGKFIQLWNVTESQTKADDRYSNRITNLAIDSKDRLYAVVDHGKELLRYEAATGKFIDKIALFGEKWMNAAQEASVMDMVVLNDDRVALYVSYFPRGEGIIMVSPEGKPELKYKGLLTKQDSSATVMSGSMLINVTGDIFLMNGTSTSKAYMYHFKPDGSYADRFTWDGAPTLGVSFNKYVALNSKGEIYIYNGGRSQISVLSIEGVPQRTIPLKATYMQKLALDASDNIYILTNNTVEKYPATGS